MSDGPRTHRVWLTLSLAVLAGTQAGCSVINPSSVKLVSYRDPYFPERFHVDFRECVYRVAPAGDYHVVARAEQPAKDAASSPVTQYLHVHIYWKPYPGKTPADASMTDATLRYVVTAGKGVAVYAGTGFAYPEKTFGGGLRVNLESARLRLESQTGEVPDLLGDTHIFGTLSAISAPGRAMNLAAESDRVAAR